LDTLVVTVHSVKMPVGYGKHGIKSMGRQLSVMAHLKSSTMEVKAEENCLSHVIIIAIARVGNDANYTTYRKGWRISPVVQALLKERGNYLTKGGGSPKLTVSKNISGL